MRLFNKNKIVEDDNKDNEYIEQEFSGYRYKLPNDSNLPIVNNQSKSDSLIPFGYDGGSMNFPQFVEQSIYESAPSHNSCINLAVNATVGAGYEFTNYSTLTMETKKDLEKFIKSIKMKMFVKQITKDYRLHNRINIKVTKLENGFLKFERISPAKIGYNSDKTLYFYSADFMYRNVSKIYKKYEVGCAPGEYIMDFDGIIDKYDPYPAPLWTSGFKHIKINSKIPSFHESNMENSINPGLVINRYTKFANVKEKLKWIKNLLSKKGTEGTGSALVFSSASKEDATEVMQLKSNENNELFKELRESSIDDICMAHNINPVLIGVKTAGSLGANQEAQLAWNIFSAIVVEDMRDHIEFTVNTLLEMNNIRTEFKLNEKNVLGDLGPAPSTIIK